jgi:sarcosine dehydrogenase
LGSNEDQYEIKTDIVVNASGVWAPNIAKMVGIENLPQKALEHAYVITEPMPEFVSPLKIPNIRDHDLSIYLRTSGQSLKIGGYETNPEFLRFETKSLSAFTLFDLNWDSFGINLENAIKLMPRLRNVGIQTTICGPESFTPDHKPFLGEDPKVRGYFHASGFNALGNFAEELIFIFKFFI